MYSFSSANGKLAWTKGTGSYVYSSPAVAPGAGRAADGLLRLLRRHASTPSTRATARQLWRYRDGGKISGGATVIGDIVYFSNYGKKDDDRARRAARAGRSSTMGRGAFNPVISDGRTIFLTGYSSAVRAQAAEAVGRIGKPAAAIAALTSAIVWVP